MGGQSVTRGYDPLTRLSSMFVNGNVAPTEFLWFGDEMIGEYYNGTFALLYVHGPGVDEPLVSVHGNGNRFWFHADERGSVIAGSDPAGAAPYVKTYDEYGRGGGSGAFRFGFTGQIALGPDRYYFKARMYDPGLGRFLQTDPIGYGAGMNMYAYVKGDPVNFGDPSGLAPKKPPKKPPVICTGSLIRDACGPGGGIAGSLSGFSSAGPGGQVAGHWERVNAGGLGISIGSDIEITGSFRWVPDNWVSGLMPIPAAEPVSSSAPQRQARQDWCGAADSPGVPDRLMGADIGGACAVHDRCYSTPGANKEGCDAKLGSDVALLCAIQTGQIGICQIAGVSYFIGVTVFGHRPYRDAQRNTGRR